ncbi:MAG: hypothetical protein QNJ55_35725 [Xenococcus sp. MO_188.B8]|nr:hypothetical protein [Xenococcus sp. MO_188.B8]
MKLKKRFSTAFSLAFILAIVPTIFAVVWLFQQVTYPKVAACSDKKMLVSDQGHFRICYQGDQAGADGYAKKLAIYLEKSWDFYKDYGYQRIEQTLGDNGMVEVWIEDTGYTPINGLAFRNGQTNTYRGLTQPKQKEPHLLFKPGMNHNALQHFAAHEFFHLVQFEYVGLITQMLSSGRWFIESAAAQVSEEVFDTRYYINLAGANIYADPLSTSLQYKDVPDYYRGTLLFRFLKEKYNQPQALIAAFENLGLVTTHEAFLYDYIDKIDSRLKPNEVFRDFWKWNYFVGNNVRYGHPSYSDAQYLAPAPFPESNELYVTLDKQQENQEINGSLVRSSAVLYRIQPADNEPKSLILELNSEPKSTCTGSFAVTIDDENALINDLIPGHKIRVDSFQKNKINWVDLIITNGCFDRLDNMKYGFRAKILSHP